MTLPALSLLPLVLALSSPATSQELLVPAEVVDIHDGDTFVADAKPWPGVTIRVSVRLAGVDTPDMNGKCEDEKQKARQAKSLLQALLGYRGGTVILKDPKRGKYAGRVISRVIVRGGHDATTRMIKSGYGRPYDGGKRKGWCGD